VRSWEISCRSWELESSFAVAVSTWQDFLLHAEARAAHASSFVKEVDDAECP
jgi:hypothetical protein